MNSFLSGFKAVSTNIMKSNKYIVLLLVILTALVYSSAVNNDFTNWDDNNYITSNPHIKDFSKEGLNYLLTERTGLGGTRLTLVSFWIDYHFWKLNPMPYHLENILWHILNTILVFFLFIRLNNNRRVSLIVAVLFAVHPMHVESVAWISERKDVLFTFFLLASLHSYISYLRIEKTGYRIICWFLFTGFFYLSWHSKFSAIVLPFLLFLIDFYLKRKFSWLIIAEKLPILFFLGWEVHRMAFGSVTHMPVQNLKKVYESHPTDSFNIYDKTLLASYSLIYYLMKFFLPVNLSAIVPYPVKIKGSFPDLYFQSFILSIILSILLLVLIIRFWKKGQAYIFGFLFFMVSLAPFLHYISIKGVVVVADRYTYVPYIGMSFLVALFFDHLLKGKYRLQGWLILGSVIVLLSYLSFERNKVWKNNITLFTDVLEKNPKVVQAYNNRGNAYNEMKEYKLALADFTKAIKISPTFKFLYNNRSFSWAEMDCTRLAMNDLNMAMHLDPYYIDPYLNKAKLLMSEDKYQEAIFNYSNAIKLAPGRSSIYVQRARAYIFMSMKDSAITDYARAIKLFPNNKDAYYERGRIYSFDKEYSAAIQDFQKAILIDPEVPEYYNELGDVYNNIGKYKEALETIDRAIKIKPDFTEAFNNRGIAYFNLGNSNQALNDFNTSLKIDSLYSKAYSNRGNLWVSQSNFQRAISDFSRAISLNPNDYLSYVNRGNVYFQINEKELACKDWNYALNLNFKPIMGTLNTYCK